MGNGSSINNKNAKIGNEQSQKLEIVVDKQVNQNQQFNNSIEQMKFSCRQDIFKQKSQQAKFQINLALESLKKNQLLTTGEFAKLRKTQVLKKNNRQSLLLPKQRYEYNKNGQKKNSQSNLISKRLKSQQSKNTSSITSTLIQKSFAESFISDQYNIKDINQAKKYIQQKTNRSVQGNILQHLKHRQKNVLSLKNPLDKNGNQQNLISIQQVNQLKYENGKSIQKKKKYKNIKSQKIIPHQLIHHNQQEQFRNVQHKDQPNVIIDIM